MSQPVPDVPSDCFSETTLRAFQRVEGQHLSGVHYFLRQHTGAAQSLFALELLFADKQNLLLSAGEDGEAIILLQADTLAQIALQLEAVNGAAVISGMAASAQPIWQAALGTVLKSIQLSRHENGLYRNDALLLEFETTRVVVALSEQEGLDLFRG